MANIVSPDVPDKIYLSPVGCYEIVRRAEERNAKINLRLKEVLLSISSEIEYEENEKRSRVQKRGNYSQKITRNKKKVIIKPILFDFK